MRKEKDDRNFFVSSALEESIIISHELGDKDSRVSPTSM